MILKLKRTNFSFHFWILSSTGNGRAVCWCGEVFIEEERRKELGFPPSFQLTVDTRNQSNCEEHVNTLSNNSTMTCKFICLIFFFKLDNYFSSWIFEISERHISVGGMCGSDKRVIKSN